MGVHSTTCHTHQVNIYTCTCTWGWLLTSNYVNAIRAHVQYLTFITVLPLTRVYMYDTVLHLSTMLLHTVQMYMEFTHYYNYSTKWYYMYMYLEIQLTIKGVLHVYMYHHTTVCKLNKVRYFICWVSDIIKLLVIISWSLQSNHKDTFFLHVHVYLVICYPSWYFIFTHMFYVQ